MDYEIVDVSDDGTSRFFITSPCTDDETEITYSTECTNMLISHVIHDNGKDVYQLMIPIDRLDILISALNKLKEKL